MAKEYRVAVIGHTGRGNYGHDLDQEWLLVPSAKIVGVADADKVGLAAAAKRLSAPEAFVDYREMFDKTKPDIVAICTRWLDEHRDMAVAAAERGIHIIMEKPLCRTLAEADEIVAACEKTHVKCAVGHPTRYSPKLQTVKQLIQEGKIGRVLEYRGRGKEDSRGGSEDLWVLGSHVMDLIRAIGGHPQWCFASVMQSGVPVTKAHVVEGNEGIGPLAGDAVRAMYGMADGSIANFASYRGVYGKPSRYALQIYGSRGVLEILEATMPAVKYLPDPSWSPGRSGAQWQDVSSAGVGKPEPLEDAKYKTRFLPAIDDFLASIEEQREPLCSVYEARGAVEMIVAVFESHRQGKPVTLPLENRENPLAML